jgi:hypothetical protein
MARILDFLMRKKGDKSDGQNGVFPLRNAPVPPEILTDCERKTWIQIFSCPIALEISEPCFPLAIEYCRAVAHGNQVAEQINAIEEIRSDDNLRRFGRLIRIQDRLQGRIASLATKLRLTPQSRITPRTAGRLAQKKDRKPWQQ